MRVDTSTLVGKRLTARGFFVGDFDYRDKVVPVIREAAPLVADGALVFAVYPWSIIQTRRTSPPRRQDPAESGGAMTVRRQRSRRVFEHASTDLGEHVYQLASARASPPRFRRAPG